MKFILQGDEEILIETLTGVQLRIRATEVKKQVGVGGTSDQLELTADLPVKVGPIKIRYEDKKPVTHILVGRDHYDDIHYVEGYYPGSKREDDELAAEDKEVFGDDDEDDWVFELDPSAAP